ncbi:MAG: VOC family protein, partial [Gaiellales bacterium]
MDTNSAASASTSTESSTAPTVSAEQSATLPAALRLGVTRLIISDLDRSLPFYTEVIGLTLSGEVDDSVARL